MIKIAAFAVTLCAIFGLSARAEAATECQANMEKIFSGDGGTVYLYLNNGGGGAVVSASNANKDAVAALALTALATGRQVRVRYTANDVNCSTIRTDFEGMWLL